MHMEEHGQTEAGENLACPGTLHYKVIESRGNVEDELGLGQVSGSQIRRGLVSPVK